jgi:EthD domain
VSENNPMLVMTIYRWPGTTFEEFMDHYKKVHAQLGKGLPGVIWYESFVNKNASANWPVIGAAPVPDAFVIMKFESREALDNLQNTAEWADAMKDDIGFTSHFQMFEVDRFTWIPDPDRPEAFVA